MKTAGWRVTGEEFKIRLTFKNPELHKFITFKAEDLYGNLLISLDGDRTISVMPRTNCDEYIDVQVTGAPGKPPSRNKRCTSSEYTKLAELKNEACLQKSNPSICIALAKVVHNIPSFLLLFQFQPIRAHTPSPLKKELYVCRTCTGTSIGLRLTSLHHMLVPVRDILEEI